MGIGVYTVNVDIVGVNCRCREQRWIGLEAEIDDAEQAAADTDKVKRRRFGDCRMRRKSARGSRQVSTWRLAIYLERASHRHHIVLAIVMIPNLTDSQNTFLDRKSPKLTSYIPTCQGILSPENTRVPCS